MEWSWNDQFHMDSTWIPYGMLAYTPWIPWNKFNSMEIPLESQIDPNQSRRLTTLANSHHHHQPPTALTAHTDDDTNSLPMPGHGTSTALWITEMTCRHHRLHSGKYLLPFSILLSHLDTGAMSPTGRCGNHTNSATR